MTILTIALILVPILFGISAAAALRLHTEKVQLVLIGAIGGLAFSISLTYLFSIWLPLNNILLAIIVLGLTITTILISSSKSAWSHWQHLSLDKTALLIFVLLILLFSIIAPKLLFLENGGLYTGIINAYGDLGWHVANITSFDQGQSVPPEYPIFANTRLTYPFLTNFFSAMLTTSNATITQSVVWPALLLIPLLFTLIYCFAKNLTGYKSAAVIALLLFLLGGATLGWTRIYDDWQDQNQSFLTFITHLPDRDYSGVGIDNQGFHFLNPTFTLLFPQRTFLIGLPLALSILILLLPAHHPRTIPARFVIAGLLAGLLPLFHAHTVLALIPAIISIYLLNPKRPWLHFAFPAVLIGSPAVFYYLTGSYGVGSFFRWDPGWMSYNNNWLWYWFKNTGLLLPVILLGLFLPAPRHLKALATAGLTLFIASNLFLFAPWAWDNFKLFVYWFIFSLPLVSWIITTKLLKTNSTLVQFSLILLVIFHLSSGALDLWKISLPTSSTWQLWSKEDVDFARQISAKTIPGEIILTAPIHNSAVALSGRPQYLGHPAHIWSHGGDPWQRELGLEQFFAGIIDNLPDITPRYILIGPAERHQYPDLYIRPSWSLVAQDNQYQLYSF